MAQEPGIESLEPEAARAELERTRARMSETLDEIEDVLLRKKQDIQDRLDVKARIRERPLQAAGLVVGIGFLIGFLTGGSSKASDQRLATDARAALWESRARRLLRIAREQEEEIEGLEGSIAELETYAGDSNLWDAEYEYDAYDDYDDYDDDEEVNTRDEPSRFAAAGEALRETASKLFEEASRAVIDSVRSRR